jgi:putative endonuclease
MYYVYILKLSNGEYYTGSTSNLDNRLKQHENGQTMSTKNKRPLMMVWYAEFANKKLATDFEIYLKSSSGFAFRNKRLIE